ncbi:hypothetical protein PRUPE_4G120300 [Prunus persica]|uniref:RING-type domain-containing protein n=1 Tax=Prunus persica TaxID=3760 RepID=A0A251PJF7_PRUPE|nr:uncharacterized protein DDB_G0287625 [Prunus persica]ONI11679.1 hypothetical protein PRUPE_4G120300 [Prunus persica]
MASSQVEMAASAPFGCVLRDHSRRDRCRESNARATQAAFQNNLKSLVRDHLHTCISVSSNSASNGDYNNNNNNSQGHIENVDSWAQNKDGNNTNSNNGGGERDDGSTMTPRQSRVLDRCAAGKQGKETIATTERQSQEAELLSMPNSLPSSSRTSTSMKDETLSRTESLAEISNLGVGASSLVQIWEKRLNQSNSLKMSSNGNDTETSRSNSGLSCNENENENIFNAFPDSNASNESNASNAPSLEKQPSRGSEAGDSVFVDERYDAGPVTEDSFEDSTSDGSATSESQSNLDAREREREKVRVADIIKRLKAQCPLSSPSEDNDHDQQQPTVIASSCRERDRERSLGFDQTEQQHKGFCQVISSPRMIRGRQAFTDLLMHLERDRHRELETIVDRRAVSRFSQRGRIQSLLRIKLLQRGMAVIGQDGPRRKPAASQVNKVPQRSAIMHLREKFSTGVEQGSTAQNDAASQKGPHRGLVKNIGVHVESSSTSNRSSESTPNHEVDTIEQQNTTLLKNPLSPACEYFHEEVIPSSKVSCQGTSLVARNTLPHASEDLRDEASLSSKVTLQVTSSVARNTFPHAREDLHDEASSKSTLQGTSPIARNTLRHDSEDLHEEANPSSDVTWQGTTSVAGKTFTHASEDLHEEVSPSSEVTWQGTTSVARNTLPQVCEDLPDKLSPSSEVSWQGSTSAARNLDLQETTDTTTSLVCWDENDVEEQVEDDYEYYGEYSYDWITEISRPRSYWEDLRKAWYQEMLDSNSGKGDIRQLIERRTVSNFLASDFRDKIDRLMVSRIERQTYPVGSEEGEDEEISQDRMNQLVSFLQQRQQQMRPADNQEQKQQVQEQKHQQEEEDMTEEEEDDHHHNDEEEARSLISAQYQEASDDFDQCTSLQPSPSHMTAWSYQDNEVGDDSDRAASISPPRHLPSQSYYPNSRECSPSPSYHRRHYSSSTNHPSIEMELIYDMRGQMEQLHNEMSELRKAIKGCVDMQMMMQQSIKQEVHSGQAERKRSSNGLPKKGNCCICHEVKVDSLLYRCGHMCTCLKCAHELQWNNGKCPICRAPIVDVVRAHLDY